MLEAWEGTKRLLNIWTVACPSGTVVPLTPIQRPLGDTASPRDPSGLLDVDGALEAPFPAPQRVDHDGSRDGTVLEQAAAATVAASCGFRYAKQRRKARVQSSNNSIG